MGGLGAVVEYMAKVSVTPGAAHFSSGHPMASVGLFLHVVLCDRRPEARPACSGIELRIGAEYLEAAKLCIAKGNDVNAANGQGFTAMTGAANRGFNEMIQLLAANGAKLDAKDKQGRTPMSYAEGVFLAVNPAVNKPATIALLKQLMGAADAK